MNIKIISCQCFDFVSFIQLDISVKIIFKRSKNIKLKDSVHKITPKRFGSAWIGLFINSIPTKHIKRITNDKNMDFSLTRYGIMNLYISGVNIAAIPIQK